MNRELVEQIAERVHEAWVQMKLSQGITSRPASDGEEQMVPYSQLSETAKNLDRATVQAVLAGIEAAGLRVTR